METVQGYVILKAATFETGHGFALGHNPGAPSPFVTWQFTEGENGHRDYYWGRYGTSQAWAQRDFDRRVDDYQQFYHAAVKHTELGPEGVYRYYSTQRPVDIGTYPKPPDNQPLSIVNYDDDRRRPVADGRLMAWGELTYAKPLTEKQMEDYELPGSSFFILFLKASNSGILISIARIILTISRFSASVFAISAALKRFKSASYLALEASILSLAFS